MGLSVKKEWVIPIESLAVPLEIHIRESQIQRANGEKQLIQLDEWPAMVFLKAVGFDRVKIHRLDPDGLSQWLERMASYEQLFLQDPEYLNIDEAEWNQLDADSSSFLVECFQTDGRPRSQPAIQPRSFTMAPPLQASLGLQPENTKLFLEEIRSQSTLETLRRIEHILNEYKLSDAEREPEVWAFLVADIIVISLGHRFLDRSVHLSQNHEYDLLPVWREPERALRLFSAFDPKPAEIPTWAKIFKSCSHINLLNLYDRSLGTSANPQIAKLLNFRAGENSDEFLKILPQAAKKHQELILQWMGPHWQSRHFDALRNFWISKSRDADTDFVRLLIQSMLRARRADALDEFEKHFRKPSWFGKLTARELEIAKLILSVLMENPSIETAEFFRKVRSRVSGELADRIEKYLAHFSKVRT